MTTNPRPSRNANRWTGQRRDVLTALTKWLHEGRRAVLATVISTDSSAPRGIGAQLAIREDGMWVGGVSGGCAESELLLESNELLNTLDDRGSHGSLIHLTRDELSAAGPICGATLGIILEVVDDQLVESLREIQQLCAGGDSVVVKRAWTSHARSGYRDQRAQGRTFDHLPDLTLDGGSISVASAPEAANSSQIQIELHDDGSLELTEFIEPAPKLLICGAGDVGTELIHLGKRLGWRSTLLDPRASWIESTVSTVTPDSVLATWPSADVLAREVDPVTACIACSHDAKLDLPFITHALSRGGLYVGSVGSRATQAVRIQELTELVGPKLAGLHRGPAGLHIADNTAAGIALSIVAEVSQRLQNR